MQRKVNILQQKLVEKSNAIPTNDNPEHSTARKISPKTNIKADNTSSSTQTKITEDEKKPDKVDELQVRIQTGLSDLYKPLRFFRDRGPP